MLARCLKYFSVICLSMVLSQYGFTEEFNGRTWHYFDKYSPVEDNQTFNLKFKLKQKGQSYENDLESSFLYTIEGTPEFKYKANKYFTINSEVSISSRIGSVQSRFGDLRSRSAIIIRDTRFKFHNEYINKSRSTKFGSYLSIGAIDQSRHHRNFENFISKRALPGLEEQFVYEKKTKKGIFGLDLRGFQGIPTAQSNTLDFTEKETTPTFVSTNIEASYKREQQKNNFRLTANYGLFSFSDLPAAIADESRLYGNSVNFVGAASEFEYGFKGWFGGWSAQFSRGRFSTLVSVDMLQNLDAPDTRNQAQKISARVKYIHSKNLILEASPFSFFTESDASIASYNQLAGHNNREGYGFRFTFDLPIKKFKINLDYAKSDLIETNVLQLEQDFFGFTLEYKNDLI